MKIEGTEVFIGDIFSIYEDGIKRIRGIDDELLIVTMVNEGSICFSNIKAILEISSPKRTLPAGGAIKMEKTEDTSKEESK